RPLPQQRSQAAAPGGVRLRRSTRAIQTCLACPARLTRFTIVTERSLNERIQVPFSATFVCLRRMIPDFRYAWRSIARMPIVAAVVVVSLAIGIGVNTAVFSWIEAVVFRPLPGVPQSSASYLVEPRADTGSYAGGS